MKHKIQDKKYSILVVGSGGTGTFFLKEFARYLYKNIAALSKIKQITIADGDTVEAKNLSRQAFSPDDLGFNKASVMVEVLSEAFSLSNMEAVDQYLLTMEDINKCFSNITNGVIPVIIGCSDNVAVRLLCEEFFESKDDCVYIDSANGLHDGETVVSLRLGKKEISPCRSIYFPQFALGDTRSVVELSCEELNESTPQHILANMNAGMALLSNVVRLLEKDELDCGVTFFNPFEGKSEFVSVEKHDVSMLRALKEQFLREAGERIAS